MGRSGKQLITSTSMPASEANVNVDHNEGVYEIRIAPSNSNIFYMEYLGYVYRSTDKGATWTKTNFAHVAEDAGDTNRMDGQKMAVDPNNPKHSLRRNAAERPFSLRRMAALAGAE